MRIALLSDSHGNAVGLQAALDDVERRSVDRMVYLGDALQGGSQPVEVIEFLQKLDCPVVMGNSDSWLVTGESAEQVPPAAHEIRDWTRSVVGNEGLRFIESFQSVVEIEVEGGRRLLCFHGSPSSFDDVVLPETPEEEAIQALGGTGADFLAGGHTHLQWTRRVGESIFFNPGSAGVSYNRYLEQETFYFYPIAEYAILETTEAGYAIEFCKVPFDVDALEHASKGSGRPYSEREADRYRPRS